MVVIGLTGNLGSGKTTVAQMFEELGAERIDADEIVHDLLIEDGPCGRKIRKTFPEAIDPDGIINRKRLAGAVFKNQKKLKELEGLLHPAVTRRISQILDVISRKKVQHVVVLDIPLLFETGLDRLADAVVVVRADRVQQISRVVKSRRMTRVDAAERLRQQMPQNEKMKRADFVIDNRFSKAKTRAQVVRIWEGLVRV